MAFCTECGARLTEGAKFCAECGAPVSARSGTAAEQGNLADRTSVNALASTIAAGSLVGAAMVEAPAEAGEFVAGTWEHVATTSTDATAGQPQAYQHGGQFLPSDGGAARKRRRSRLPFLLALAAALVAVAVYVVPLFIPHPHDPHEDMALTSETASEAAEPEATAPEEPEPTVPAAPGAAEDAGEAAEPEPTPEEPEPTTPSAPSAPEEPEPTPEEPEPTAPSTQAAPPTSSAFSTDERPQLIEFTWLTGSTAKGNVPDGATRLTGFADVEGGWKGYLYAGDMEWLLNAHIDSVQDGAAITIDWYYLRIGGVSGEVKKDDTADSLFNGAWADGQLDATGSGRVLVKAFWQQDDHQYAAGSFTWPDGETGTIILMRP